MSRPRWDQTFLTIALAWSKRSTCPRLATGAVIVTPDKQAITAGYNGAIRGDDHCTDAGCLMVAGHCERAVHAEMNAILQAARVGVSVKGCTLYCLHFPCGRCTRLAVQAGISEIVFRDYYPKPLTFDIMEAQAATVSLCRRVGVTIRTESILNVNLSEQGDPKD